MNELVEPTLCEIIEHPCQEDSAYVLADAVACDLERAICTNGEATLVVSGGRSPIAFFQALRIIPLAWDRVTITLADERQVPPHSPLSNERLVREELLWGPVRAARFVRLLGSETASQLTLPFTSVVLGMGTDGHIASLFPQCAWQTDEGPIIALMPDPIPIEAPVARWSWTIPSLVNCDALYLQIAGSAKRAILHRALDGDMRLPVAQLLRQARKPVAVHWVLS